MDKLAEKQRSLLQNRCMWKYFEEVARECQNAGISPQVFVKAFSVDVTPRMVEDVWRAIIELKYGHSSTTRLTSRETSETYEEMNRGLSSFGLLVEWPSWGSVIYRENK